MAFEAPDMVALATDPIRPDQPAGDSVTYDPDFEAMKAEIGKLDRGEQPAWPDIVTKGSDILKTRGKDLTVACYVAVGLFHQKGFPGLAGGLLMVDALLTTHWDTLYPEKNRVRGRVAALSWMHDRAAHAVSRKSPNRSDNEPAEAALEALRRIAALSDDRLGQDSPAMNELTRTLESVVRDSATPTPSAAPAAAPSSSGGGSMPGLTLDSWDGALRSIGTVGGEIEKIVAYMINYNPGSPIPYLLNRGLAWCRIIEPPPAGDDGLTPFPPPDPGMIAGWEALAAGNQWKQLVEEAEKRLTSAPFLLDINYHVARGLDGLGNPVARQAVVEETAALLRRLPRLLELKYQDGRPFASEATKAWLEASGGAAGGGTGGGSGTGEAPDDPLGPATQEARTLAARGKLGDAVTLLTDGMLQCPSPRDRFRWRLALAGVCLDAGQAMVAVAHLEALDDDVERHGLESWEPGLASEWLKVFYRCEKKLSQNGQRDQKEAIQRLDRLYGRLCRIDTLSALSLESRR